MALYTGSAKTGYKLELPAKEKKVSITVKQLQKTPFSFPLEIQLKNGAGTKAINISKQEETFVIPVKEKPGKLVLDPNTVSVIYGNCHREKIACLY